MLTPTFPTALFASTLSFLMSFSFVTSLASWYNKFSHCSADIHICFSLVVSLLAFSCFLCLVASTCYSVLDRLKREVSLGEGLCACRHTLLPGFFGYRRLRQLSAKETLLADFVKAMLSNSQCNSPRLAYLHSLCMLQNMLDGNEISPTMVRACEQAKHNAYMHMLNGNINSEAIPKIEYASNAIEELGGVRPVLTELAASNVSPNLTRTWTPTSFPRQLTNVTPELSMNANFSLATRENSFTRHFPKLMAAPRLPQFFETTETYIQSFKASRPGNNQCLAADFSRNFDIGDFPQLPLQSRFEGLAPVFNGAVDSDSLAAASKTMALNRFLDTRGNRQVVAWEAESWSRWLKVADFSQATQGNVAWVQPLYRLWARYYFAQHYALLTPDGDLLKANLADRSGPVSHGASLTIHHINSVLNPGPAPANPEALMWTEQAQQDLRSGAAQFIDAEGMTDGEIIELISALSPVLPGFETAYAHITPRRTRVDVTPAVPAREATPTSPALDAVPQTTNEVELNARRVAVMTTGACRYSYPNGVTTIFVHWGNKTLPNQARVDAIRDGIMRHPVAMDIASTIRHVVTKYNLGTQANLALETVLYRSTVFDSQFCRSTRANLGAFQYINADGNREIFLPKALTAHAYFDVFRIPSAMPTSLNSALSMRPIELVHSSVLICQARVISLNWASYAITLLGAQLNAGIGVSNNQFLRNHTDVWLRNYNSETINLWSTLHANAMAHQYGFAPSKDTRETEAQTVVNWWRDNCAPYVLNHYNDLWMMEQIPSHQLLPYHSTSRPVAPSWPSSLPRPVSDYLSFHADVQLARDFDPFTGRTWMADGGSTRNGQFYAAQGDGTLFRFEGGVARMELAYWSSQFYHQFPQAPANRDIDWMDNINSEFGDFIQPGSLPPMQMANNRVYAWGMHLPANAENRSAISRRWYEASLGQAEQSLMINYVSPTRAKREIEALSDYSLLIWEEANRFAGITLVRHDVPDISGAAYLDKLKVPSLPDTFGMSIAPDPLQFSGGSRVTRKPFRSESTPSLMDRVSAYRQANVSTGIAYAPKVPLYSSQVPQLNDYSATVDANGISVDTFTPLGGTSPDRLAQIEAKIREASALQEAYLSEMAGSLDTLRANERDRQARISRAAAPPRPTSPRTRNQQARMAVTPYINKKVVDVYAKKLDVGGPVVPNDSAAGQVQAGAIYTNSLPIAREQRRSPPDTSSDRPQTYVPQTTRKYPQNPQPMYDASFDTFTVPAGKLSSLEVDHDNARPSIGEPIPHTNDSQPEHAGFADGQAIADAFTKSGRNAPIDTVDANSEN